MSDTNTNATTSSLGGKRFLFKTIPRCKGDGCHADVYLPKDKSGQLPLAIFIHGGAFGKGASSNISKDQLAYLLENGFMCVSLEYRLLPHANIDDMRQDVVDGYRWAIRDLSKMIGIHVAKDKVICVGNSAGGTLALYLGTDAPANGLPELRAIVAIYPMTYHYGPPNPPDEEFIKQVDEAYEHALAQEVETSVPYEKYPAEYPIRDKFLAPTAKYHLMSRYLLPREKGATTYPPSDLSPSHKAPLDLCGERFPPTVFITGTADKVVHPRNSQMMYEKLLSFKTQKGAQAVDVKKFDVEGQGHGFSNRTKRGDKEWDIAFGPALDFAIGHTKLQYSSSRR